MKTKVLLTGASGQLGKQLSSKAPPEIDLYAMSFADVDITNTKALGALLAEINPEIIINTAAYTQVDEAEQNPRRAYAVNATGVENLVRAAEKHCRIIHFSTDFVFDGEKGSAYTPSDTTNPINVYGQTKLAGEKVLRRLKPDHSLIIRTSWLYAASGRNFVNTMLDLLATRETLNVVNDQIGTPTSAAALAEIVWRFVARPEATGIFHCSDKGEASWYDFACAIQEEALALTLLTQQIPVIPVKSSEYLAVAKRPARSVLDKTGTWQFLGIEGKHWREELKAVLKDVKAIKGKGLTV